MIKNTAGQYIGAQMLTAADGSAFTGSVTVYVCGDAGSQALGSVGSGVCTHEGNGYHTYAPAQAETNYDLVAFTFIGSGAVTATVQVYTVAGPVAQQTAVDDLETRLTATRAGYLDNLSAGSVALQSSVDDLETRLTATRAGYLDNLSAGAVALDSSVAKDATVMKAASYSAPPAASAIADAVWDEALSGHIVAGSAGKALSDASALGDPMAVDVSTGYTGTQAGALIYRLNIPTAGPVDPIPAPSDPSQTTAYAYCYDETGAAIEDVMITIQVATTETTGGGSTYSGLTVTGTSGANGLATVEIPRGTHITFRARRGHGRWMQFAGVDADTVQIPYIVGHSGEVVD